MILSPYASGKGYIPFGNAKLHHVIYGYFGLDFDLEKFRQHLCAVLQVHNVDTKNYDALEERKEMLPHFPHSNSNE